MILFSNTFIFFLKNHPSEKDKMLQKAKLWKSSKISLVEKNNTVKFIFIRQIKWGHYLILVKFINYHAPIVLVFLLQQ
jgi:hypothetical protein